jgi:hypothetical protein
MSFENSSRTTTEVVPQVSNDHPTVLNEMLQNKELLTCYKCKETFNIEDDDQQQHTLDSNNILLGIILNARTPSSICLKCLSRRMMTVITEQFTKNSKDYEDLFFSYEHKFKG